MLKLVQHLMLELAPLNMRYWLAAPRATRPSSLAELCIGKEWRLVQTRTELCATIMVQLKEQEEVRRAQT
jgi:hypothetical protein